MNTDPPAVAVWLLTRRLSTGWAEYVLGDLEEEFVSRCTASPAAARRWFWRQTIRCLLAPPRDRGATTRSSPPEFHGDSMVRTLLADSRYALRVLVRTPSFTAAVVAVLALGIGANTAIFSIVNAVLLRPLPFSDADRLVRLFHVPPQSTFPGITRFSVSPANYYDWKRDAKLFESMALYRMRQFALTGDGRAEAVVAGAVEPDFFKVVGTPPALGRVFLAEEDSPARGHVAILSDGFWKTHFGGAPDVVGRTITLDGDVFTIVGVMPPRFSVNSWGVTARALWVPIAYTPEERAVRDNHNDAVVARLSPGAAIERAQAEMEAISKRLEAAYPKENAGWGATVVSLQELIVGDIRTSLVMLLVAVALVLLIACANVGNLLFARALARQKEIAIRSALGAGRRRVFQQLLVETLVLSAIGGVAGLGLAQFTLTEGATLLANQVPRADEISLDLNVLLFVAATALVTGIIAGVMPAMRAGRADLNEPLKEGGRNDSAVGVRTRRALIAAEVALSLVLLTGAAIMLRTLVNLRRVDAGFSAANVLTMRVNLPLAKYKTGPQFLGFVQTALERVRALPGVQSAGGIDDLPLLGGSVQPIVLEGHAEALPKDQPAVEVRKITRDYLKTMNIPIVRGRDVADGDTNVMLVSRSAAKMVWGDEDPIGRRATLPLEMKGVLKEVIGIVGDVKQGDLTQPAAATVYEYTTAHPWGTIAIAMKTAVPPLTLAHAAGAAIGGIDPTRPVEEIRTMQDIVDETLASQRFSALLLGVFAAVAMLLASVGIYSVLSYIVRGRSREIGIRTALGARTADVLRLVVLEGMTPAAIGIAAGVVAALAAGRLLTKLVYGVSASDPLTLLGVASVLVVIALVASAVPAYRASRIDPLTVLRS